MKWWDDRPAKRAAQAKPAGPDYRCVGCGRGRWDGDPNWPAWDPPPTEILPTVVPDASGRCVALRADGQPCQNMAMAGSDRCGPHASAPSRSAGAGHQCQGVTKAGQPCRAGAQRGRLFCPAHDPDR